MNKLFFPQVTEQTSNYFPLFAEQSFSAPYPKSFKGLYGLIGLNVFEVYKQLTNM